MKWLELHEVHIDVIGSKMCVGFSAYSMHQSACQYRLLFFARKPNQFWISRRRFVETRSFFVGYANTRYKRKIRNSLQPNVTSFKYVRTFEHSAFSLAPSPSNACASLYYLTVMIHVYMSIMSNCSYNITDDTIRNDS